MNINPELNLVNTGPQFRRREANWPHISIEELMEEIPERLMETTESRFYIDQFRKAGDPSAVTFVYNTYKDSQHVDYPVEDLRLLRDIVISLLRRKNSESANPVIETRAGVNIHSPELGTPDYRTGA